MSNTDKRALWLDFIMKNKDALSRATDETANDSPRVRNLMAEMGIELTPLQLHELTELVKDSLKIIEGENWEND